MKRVLKTRKTALAAAVAMALSAPAMAQLTPQPQLEIDQRYELFTPSSSWYEDIDILQSSTNFLGLGVYDITDDIDDYNITRIARLNLGLDANGLATVGSTQFSSQQFLTIGLGAIGPSVASALNVSSTSTLVNQIIGGGAAVQQRTENIALAFAGDTSPTNLGDAALMGLSQIGANTANAAALNLTQGGTLELVQDVYKSYTGTPDDDVLLRQNLGQTVSNTMIAATWQGEAVIDGANGTNLANRSTQFGTNVVNSALVASSSAIEIDLNQNLRSNGLYDDYFGFRDQYTGGYQSVIANTLLAQAGNFTNTGNPIDPAIRNMDQVAIFTGNSLNVVNSGTTKLYGTNGTEQLFSQSRFDLDAPPAEPVVSSNRAYAINGFWEGDYGFGGFGDAMIDKLGQTIVTSINSVSISGPSTTTTTNGVSTTTTAAAGLTRVGGIDVDFGEDGVDLEVRTFDQTASGLRIRPIDTDGPEFYTDLTYAYTLPDEYIQPDARDFAPLQRYGTGNIAFAFTGRGIAAATNLDQLQSVTVNSFSTNGALAGAVIDAATIASLGLSLDEIDDVDDYASLRQRISAGAEFRTDINLQNAAAALTSCCGTARTSGSQTLATSLNSLSASGAVSGWFQQEVDGPAVVVLNNTMLAASRGVATIGDFKVNGVMTSSPVAQTVVSSINTMSLGSVGTAKIEQMVDGLAQSSGNFAAALGNTALASNISQTVLNKLNTISAINPTPSQ
jgi:hypothetical protein